MSASDISVRVDAHKCLANVALHQASAITLESNDTGGGMMRQAPLPAAADEALSHLNKALELAPQDLSLHQGRLFVLQEASRFDEMGKALDESCRRYKGGNASMWIDYTADLFNEKHYQASLKLLQVLEKHYPDSRPVIGNLGALYSVLKQDTEALRYLKKAVELDPSDPIDVWNVARLYDYTGKTDEADRWYQRALALKWEDPESLRESRCLYAVFLETNLGKHEQACKLQKETCPAEKQTACTKEKK